MSRRWRPSLGLVLGGALGGTLTLSLVGLVAFRYLGPEVGFRNAAVIVGLILAIATAILSWLLVRLLLRPIHSLENYAAKVRSGSESSIAPPKHFGTRELHRTALSVIDMADTLRNREVTIRSYTDHVTHEIKTPVSAIRAAVELLEDSENLSASDRHLLEKVDGARAQIQTQLDALRGAAQARETRYIGTSNLEALVPVLARDYPGLLLVTAGETVPVPLAGEGLMVVLGQMLRNCAEHGARRVTIDVQRTDLRVTLTVTDDGAGISQGNAARIFDPFFTTKRDSGGTGMGLAIAQNIVAAHRGEITFIPDQNGTTFRLTFPIRP